MRIATSADRVPSNTSDSSQSAIREATERRIEYFRDHPEHIDERLVELDEEWDVERCLETGSATLTLTGLALGATVNRKWLLLSAAVQSFFLQHALQGWCPPLPVLRRLGVRTAHEIAHERCVLLNIQEQHVGRTPGARRNSQTR